ncbi:phosphotransferase family protein [Aspergillus avenaceus]|uniref:Altered inheritance of mitochondria protein 9, mitochondrial n=1 Tax=Aspergillus avenaceus TaxID=36643 RepID=A0A5N6U957_ASPAV|nr:phosphotransferase family protein [Aspergillus avenaceus]
MSATSIPQHHNNTDLFHYTSGRWLWGEEQQLRDRQISFNVPELQKIAARSVGAKTCTEIVKLAEGSFNKTFRLGMDNGLSVIARLPHPIAGYKYYTTASEVATMDYARNILDVPIPRVYSWNADADNAVGSEYIIMEEATGTKLDCVWHDFSLEQKVEVMKDLVKLEKKMLSAPLNGYGSLYYASEGLKNTIPADISGDVSVEVRNNVRDRFVLGPVAERDYWINERAEMTLDRGPWTRPQDYVISLAHREKAWIEKYATPKPQDDPLVSSASQNSPCSHITLLYKYRDIAPYLLPTEPTLVAPYIRHTDLHAGNIFVQDGRITSVIDWQGIWTAPLLLRARHPRLVDYDGDIILKAPANFKDLDPNKKARIKGQMSSSIILYLYERQITKEVPLLSKALHFPYGKMRCDPVLFAGDTWDDDIIPLRESLIRMERDWDKLGFDFPCPIHFTEDELRIHEEESEGWNDVQGFWNTVSNLVARDGWTTHEDYDEAVALFAELREIGLKSMVGKQKATFEKQTRWVK